MFLYMINEVTLCTDDPWTFLLSYCLFDCYCVFNRLIGYYCYYYPTIPLPFMINLLPISLFHTLTFI